MGSHFIENNYIPHIANSVIEANIVKISGIAKLPGTIKAKFTLFNDCIQDDINPNVITNNYMLCVGKSKRDTLNFLHSNYHPFSMTILDLNGDEVKISGMAKLFDTIEANFIEILDYNQYDIKIKLVGTDFIENSYIPRVGCAKPDMQNFLHSNDRPFSMTLFNLSGDDVKISGIAKLPCAIEDNFMLSNDCNQDGIMLSGESSQDNDNNLPILDNE